MNPPVLFRNHRTDSRNAVKSYICRQHVGVHQSTKTLRCHYLFNDMFLINGELTLLVLQ